MSKVSIIVPIYNTEKYLDKCITSLINQTFSSIEILLINDGSTDNSFDVASKYKDNRIKLINNDNRGVSYSRNLGIEKASGKYIMFVDSDDYVSNDFVGKSLEAIEKANSDIVVFGSEHYYSDSNEIVKRIQYQNKVIDCEKNHDYVLDIELCPWNKIYNKQFLIDNSIKFPLNAYYEDFVFTLELCKYLKNVCYIDDILYYYAVDRSGNLSNDISKSYDIFNCCQIINNSFKERNVFNKYYDELKAVEIINIIDILKKVIKSANKEEKKSFINKYFDFIKTNFNDFNSKYDLLNSNKDFIYKSKMLLSLYMFIKGY